MSPPQSPINSPMTESRDQARPLAPASRRIHVENEDREINATSLSSMELAKKKRRRRCIKCCSCCGVTTIIIGVIILILALTVFKVKDPRITINSINFDGLSYLTSASNLQPNVNITVAIDLSIKNPNAASFKFQRATTNLIYDNKVVAEALTPPGNARARRTLRMNVIINLIVEKLLGTPRLTSDLLARQLPVSTHTEINGRVKILGVIKKSAGITLNCNMVVDLDKQEVKSVDCKNKVSL